MGFVVEGKGCLKVDEFESGLRCSSRFSKAMVVKVGILTNDLLTLSFLS